jgi:hypothetical protein
MRDIGNKKLKKHLETVGKLQGKTVPEKYSCASSVRKPNPTPPPLALRNYMSPLL